MYVAREVLMKRLRETPVLRCEPAKLDMRTSKREHIPQAGRKFDSKLMLDLDELRLGCRWSEDERTRIETLARQGTEDEAKTTLKIHGGVIDA